MPTIVTELSRKHCTPCEGDCPAIVPNQVHAFLAGRTKLEVGSRRQADSQRMAGKGLQDCPRFLSPYW